MNETAPPSIRVLNLSQRAILLKATPFEALFRASAELARKRLARWRSQAPYDRPGVLESRLEKDGLSPQELETLLGLTGASRSHPFVPERWSPLVDLWKARLADSNSGLPANMGRGLTEEGFVLPALPAVQEAEAELRRTAKALPFGREGLPLIEESVFYELGTDLRRQIREVITRTMVLEMHVAKAQGVLTASDPDARYREFLLRFLDPALCLSLLEEYPVLTRLIDQRIAAWFAVTRELLERLAADWLAIAGKFPALSQSSRLEQVRGGLGDLHRGGRSVHMLTFAGGGKLLYKPRSLSLDEHFAELCQWLQTKEPSLDLRIPPVLSREEYGWCTFVEMEPCASLAGVERFYLRLGALLALLYALQATDFHYENLIAAGEYPTPIDFEALLHARIDEGARTPMSFLRAIQEDSVLRVGLLPRLLFAADGQSDGIDISGMGGSGGQLSPTKVMVAEESYTDAMRIVRRQVPMEGSKNQPSLKGESIQASAFVEQVVDGFVRTCRCIREGVDQWTGPQGLLESFGTDQLRLVVRPTMVYAKILQESYHPNLLRDAVDRDRLLERLWLGCVQRPQLEAYFRSEKRDLSDGEIPAFFFQPNGRQVWDAAHESLGELLARETLSIAQEEIRLTEQSIAEEQWWLRASLAASATRGIVSTQGIEYSASSNEEELSPSQLLDSAAQIGDRVLASARRSGIWLHWRGLHYFPARWNAGVVGIDLYNGTAGICLFLAHLGAATGNHVYTDAAREALVTSLEYVHQIRDMRSRGSSANVGAFFGEAGLCLCLDQVSELWQEPLHRDQAAELLTLLAKDSANSRLSLGAGLAGLLLVSAECAFRNSKLSSLVEQLAAITMQRRMKSEASAELDVAACAWLDGWCGLGHALTVAGEFLQDEALIASGIASHRRGVGLADQATTGAAKGASSAVRFGTDKYWVWRGIADIEAHRPESFGPEMLAEMISSVGNDIPAGLSFHHGWGAHVGLLLDLHSRNPSGGLQLRARRLASRYEEALSRFDTPHSIETPGLMVGLSGVGATLLRCARPESMRLFRALS